MKKALIITILFTTQLQCMETTVSLPQSTVSAVLGDQEEETLGDDSILTLKEALHSNDLTLLVNPNSDNNDEAQGNLGKISICYGKYVTLLDLSDMKEVDSLEGINKIIDPKTSTMVTINASHQPQISKFISLKEFPLTYLNLSNCELLCIPSEVEELASLKVLILDRNNITFRFKRHGGNELSKMKKLTYLSMKNNELKEMPEDIFKPLNRCVKKLDFSDNKFDHFYRYIYRLRALTDLNLKGNPLKSARSIAKIKAKFPNCTI